MKDRMRERIMQNIKYYRKLRDLSQKKLAHECSLSANFISEIETGRKFPSLKTMEKLSKVLAIGAEDLLMEREVSVGSGFYGQAIDAKHMSDVMMRYVAEEIRSKYQNDQENPSQFKT